MTNTLKNYAKKLPKQLLLVSYQAAVIPIAGIIANKFILVMLT